MTIPRRGLTIGSCVRGTFGFAWRYSPLRERGPGKTPGLSRPSRGTGSSAYSGDEGPAAQAGLILPVEMFADPAGNVYIADQFNHRIRKVDGHGVITTIAGTGSQGYSGDGGPATAAQINTPISVFVDSRGNIIFSDVGNQRIRKIDIHGVITTVAGNGGKGYGGDGGAAIQATFYNPVRAVADAAGNIYIADQSNHRVREVDTHGIVATIAGTGVAGFSETADRLSAPASTTRRRWRSGREGICISRISSITGSGA